MSLDGEEFEITKEFLDIRITAKELCGRDGKQYFHHS